MSHYTPDEIAAALNNYEGDNIWQDVIYDVVTAEEWEAAPESSDRFRHDGVDYRHEQGQWVWRDGDDNSAVAK